MSVPEGEDSTISRNLDSILDADSPNRSPKSGVKRILNRQVILHAYFH